MRVAPGFLMLLAATACSTTAPARRDVDPAAAERGRSLAGRACSGCHAVAAADVSPVPAAPPLRTLAHRHDPVGVERRLQEVNAAGHGMPPRWLTDGERRDLAAYVASFD